MKSSSDASPDPEWNEGKLVDDGPEQSWLNDMAKATKPPLTFDELMHTAIDFSAFAMNHLKIDNLTKELLVGPVYDLLKGTCKSYVDLDWTMKKCYRALSEQLDWNNPEGHRCPYDLTKPLHMQMTSQGHQIVLVDFFFNNDLEYLRGGSNDKKYTASTAKFKVASYELKGIKDMVPNMWSSVKCMRTRNSYFPNNSSVTIPRRRNKRRAPNVVEPELRTIVEVAPMADNRTIRSYSKHPRKGGNLLSKTTREVLNIIENKSKVHYSRNKPNVSRMNTNSKENASKTDDRIDKLADQILTLVVIVSKKVVTLATVKAVEESYVTCGGNHAYYNCDATNSNQSSVCAATGTYNQVVPQNRASNHMVPPDFAPV
nr:hypothetical protein [Tanacetum cinerariifolium]